MDLSYIYIFLFFNFASYSVAQIPGRFGASCGYLSQKIYCFGGSASVDMNAISDSSLMYLNIANGSGISTTELASKWTTITSITNGVNVQSRNNPQSMVLSDGKTLLLSGGWNSAISSLVSQTIAYNADNNSWVAYPSYTEPPFGVRQIYYASSVYIPEYGVGFYGGMETNINQNWTYRGQNMSQFIFPEDITSRMIGYTSLTFFDIRKAANPWLVFPTQNNLPTGFSALQTSIFDALSNTIFFFGGGRYSNSTVPVFSYYSFNTSVTFNVTSGTWGLQILGGAHPSDRSLHTTTLLSSTNRHVLLYGGENTFNNDRPSLDYLFTLNLDSYEWKQQYIHYSDALDLTRSRHSAVPVYNDTVFIVFGINLAGVAVSSMITLNVTDPSNILYLSAYVDPNIVTRSSISHGLSTGATAGIAVGSVAGGLIVIGAFLCVRKKRKDKKKKEELKEINRQNERIEAPVMEVNWEAIDENFASNSTNKFSFSPRLSDDQATLADNKSEQHTRSMIIPQGLDFQRPNAIDDDFNSPRMMVQKPDGGH